MMLLLSGKLPLPMHTIRFRFYNFFSPMARAADGSLKRPAVWNHFKSGLVKCT
jgi:hypothetical protein